MKILSCLSVFLLVCTWFFIYGNACGNDNDCPCTEYTLNGVDQYLEFAGKIPRITQFTFCTFVTTNENGVVDGVIGHYATSRRQKAIVVEGGTWGTNRGLIITLMGKEQKIPNPLKPNTEYHFCFVIQVSEQNILLYLNGMYTRSFSFNGLKAIKKGGKLLIGKAGYKEGTFKGKIRNLMGWGTKLTDAQIKSLYSEYKCPMKPLLDLAPENVISFGSLTDTIDCHDTKFTLNNSGDHVEYVETDETLPDLECATVCVTLTTDAKGMIPGTIGSYAFDKKTVLATNGEVGPEGAILLRFTVNGQSITADGQFMPNTEYRMCIAYHLKHGFIQTYINGKEINKHEFTNPGTIPAGGTVIVGQLQGCAGGCFDEERAYTGTIKNFKTWGKILTLSEIQGLAQDPPKCPGCPAVALMNNTVIHTHGPCPSTEFTLDNAGDDHEHEFVEVLATLPDTKYLTICVYATTNALGALQGTVGSYAVDGQNDAIVTAGEMNADNKPTLRFMVNGKAKFIPRQFMPNTEYLFCLTYDLPKSQVSTYINGQFATLLQYENLGSLKGGGEIVIGQRQGCVGGCFVESKGFSGKLRNFMMWTKILPAEELKEIAEDNHCEDAAITLTEGNAVLHAHGPCPPTEFTMDNTGTDKEYVEVLKTLPNTDYLTICSRATTNALGALQGTIGSYAVDGQNDALATTGEMNAENKPVIKVTVNGNSKFIPKQFMPKTEYLFCLTYDLPKGQVRTYVNGKLATLLQYENLGSLKGGGKIVIGQKQGCVGGCFVQSKGFTGKLRNIMIWTRMLSVGDLEEIAEDDHCPVDAVITLTKGNAVFHAHAHCPSTEFTLDNTGTTNQYVEVLETLPNTDYLTICVYATTNALGALQGTVGSYAVDGQNDAIVTAGEMNADNKPTLRFMVNGKSKFIPRQFMPNTEYLFCLTYDLPKSQVTTYINGKFATLLQYENLGSLKGGGKIVIGQQQGCVGGCFVQSKGFSGKLRNFMMWTRMLSVEDLEEIAEDDHCPVDQTIDLTASNIKDMTG